MTTLASVDAVLSLRAYAFLGLPVGLATGLALGLVARREAGWGGYLSFRRRAARLAHVSAVMLPVIAGVFSLLLAAGPFDAAAARWGAWLWIAGGIALALSLFAAAWRPQLFILLPVPAVAVAGGALAFAAAFALA